ncbi:hypothetical protein Cni_G14964 [Canna indica]|uniref:Uncharacterized protein n=1 Tax=Canna indica TaxID=4628 RepID=A0AAQ3KD51_9LILI|nr:hypothetical protein Cni_G14964 [Canna indica]
MISTTRREECPGGISSSTGKVPARATPTTPGAAGEAHGCVGRRLGFVLREGFLGSKAEVAEEEEEVDGYLGKRKTTSLTASEVFPQESSGFLVAAAAAAEDDGDGVRGWTTSSMALLLQCRDFNHPVAAEEEDADGVRGWTTSSMALFLQCMDFNHPVAINGDGNDGQRQRQ